MPELSPPGFVDFDEALCKVWAFRRQQDYQSLANATAAIVAAGGVPNEYQRGSPKFGTLTQLLDEEQRLTEKVSRKWEDDDDDEEILVELYDDVEGWLQKALYMEIVFAYAASITGELKLIPNYVWKNDTYFQWARFGQLIPLLEASSELTTIPLIHEGDLVRALREEVVEPRFRAFELGPLETRLRGSNPSNRLGRPTKFDGEALLIEAFCLIQSGVRPSSQADLGGRALQAYSDTLPEDVEPPTIEWAKPKIRRLWERLRLGPGRA